MIGKKFSLMMAVLSICFFAAPAMSAYHVAVNGSDVNGNGSSGAPWATITRALDSVPDDSVILVHPGTYNGRVRMRGSFNKGVIVRASIPYQARLRHSATVITAYDDNVHGIVIEGFDIAHDGPGAAALVVHIDGGGTNEVSNITFKNNILHDSYNNDILKINNAATDILVEGNIFYNQWGSDEHIDLNSIRSVTVQDNIFFNDFAGSGRINPNNTSSYIVIKDSNGADDIYQGSRNVQVRRNIFLHWEGSTGSNYVLIGEDGKPYFEGEEIVVENNLMLGDAANVMRASFGVKGGRNILFRNNTISGDLPALACAMRLNREGANPANRNIQFYNNIWADQTGTMGASSSSGAPDFSDTPAADTASFTLRNNLYWNGGLPLPIDTAELINPTDDAAAIIADPKIGIPRDIVLPRWDQGTSHFADGSATIRAVFTNLIVQYCLPQKNSRAIDNAYAPRTPSEDILGNPRPAGGAGDIGACEFIKESGENGVSLPPLLHLLLNGQ